MSGNNLRSIDLVIKNARIYFKDQITEGGIAATDGKIVKVGKSSKMPSAEHIIDAKNNLIIPGAIDIHAHLRDLNYVDKEDFYTGTCAAANGGITTVIDMPNTNPPTISSNLLQEKMETAQKKIVTNVGFYSGIPDELSDLKSLVNSGIFGFKLYLATSLGNFDITSRDSLEELLQRVCHLNVPLLIHAERKEDIEKQSEQIKSSNLSSQESYLRSHSDEVEKRAIEFFLELNRPIGTHVHVCHVSTASGVEIIRRKKSQGDKITAEVTPHHLLLSVNDLQKYGTYTKMLPPLRTPDQAQFLWKGLNDGVIDVIATDHAPHGFSEKECDFSVAANGIPGFETLIPLLFTAMHDGKIELSQLVQKVAVNPAKFLNLQTKGKIEVGFDADLTVIDAHKKFEIDVSKFYTKAKFSPFHGREVIGLPVMTIINGCIVMQEGEILIPKGTGKIIKRQ